jgi:hypothetical protein
VFPTTRFDYAQEGKKVGKYRSEEVSQRTVSPRLPRAVER